MTGLSGWPGIVGLLSWFGLGWIAHAWLMDWRLRRRRKAVSAAIEAELGRHGMKVEQIHWAGDLPAGVHVRPVEGAHDAD